MTLLDIIGITIGLFMVAGGITIILVFAYTLHLHRNYDYDDELTEYLKNHSKSKEEKK